MSPAAAHPPVAYMARTKRYYEAQGYAKPYVWAHFDEVPFTRPAKPLAESTLAIITTSALHDRQATDPRCVASASTTEAPPLFANDLAWDKKATHLDDRETFLPLAPLRAMVDEGGLGALAKRFHCVPTEYSQRRTRTEDAPEILRRCREDGADIALLVPL